MKTKTFLLAIAVAALCAGMFAAGRVTAASMPTVKQVLTQPLAEVEGKEVRILDLEFGPGADSPPHHHPGETFVFVTQGELVTVIDDGPAQTNEAGTVFHEPPRSLHASSRNPSATETAHAIAFMIIDKDQPTTLPGAHKHE